jgi:hypothetical protein
MASRSPKQVMISKIMRDLNIRVKEFPKVFGYKCETVRIPLITRQQVGDKKLKAWARAHNMTLTDSAGKVFYDPDSASISTAPPNVQSWRLLIDFQRRLNDAR